MFQAFRNGSDPGGSNDPDDPIEIYGFDDDALQSDLPPGTKCFKKIVMVDVWITDEEQHCKIVKTKSCFQTMTTVYKTAEVC